MARPSRRAHITFRRPPRLELFGQQAVAVGELHAAAGFSRLARCSCRLVRGFQLLFGSACCGPAARAVVEAGQARSSARSMAWPSQARSAALILEPGGLTENLGFQRFPAPPGLPGGGPRASTRAARSSGVPSKPGIQGGGLAPGLQFHQALPGWLRTPGRLVHSSMACSNTLRRRSAMAWYSCGEQGDLALYLLPPRCRAGIRLVGPVRPELTAPAASWRVKLLRLCLGAVSMMALNSLPSGRLKPAAASQLVRSASSSWSSSRGAQLFGRGRYLALMDGPLVARCPRC